MNKTYNAELLLLFLLPFSSFATPHIAETMTLSKGWNAIYLESTPTNAACDDFFAGAPVARVASYYSDAYSSTRQLADDGTEIGQKPVSYHVWVPGDEAASTMSALVGGRVYVIFVENFRPAAEEAAVRDEEAAQFTKFGANGPGFMSV